MYDQKFWNERYAGDGELYGTDPNSFLVEYSKLLTGSVLSLSEGEGHAGLASVVQFIARKRS